MKKEMPEVAVSTTSIGGMIFSDELRSMWKGAFVTISRCNFRHFLK
jgi:hypothetical protein